uniref:Uncharacterized protein n=1 Tax=Tanacetum cinerariifolium TaxID=118510 RepID=A0A6L2KJI2_TANCI|nr:hypothetical protein [Tanacetum cinerariifolium]
MYQADKWTIRDQPSELLVDLWEDLPEIDLLEMGTQYEEVQQQLTTIRQLKPVNRTYFTVALEMKNAQASGGVEKRETIKNVAPLGL